MSVDNDSASVEHKWQHNPSSCLNDQQYQYYLCKDPSPAQSQVPEGEGQKSCDVAKKNSQGGERKSERNIFIISSAAGSK